MRPKARVVTSRQNRRRVLLLLTFANVSVISAGQSPPVSVAQPVEFAPLEASSDSMVISEQAGALGSTQGMTLSYLEQLALQANPSIARLSALVSAARGNAVQVGLSPNPEVGFEGQQLGSDGRAEQYGVLLNQELVVREKLRLNRSVAFAEVRRLEQEREAQRQRVLTDVRIAFARALRAEAQLRVANELVLIAEQAKASADALLEAAEVSRIDVLQAEIEVENSAILQQNSENRKAAALQSLGAVVGQPLPLNTELQGDLFVSVPGLDFESTLSQVQQSSPEIASVLALLERSRANLCRQIIEPRPNVTVQGLVNWQDNGVDGDSNAGITVSIPVPIWNRNQGAIHEARQQIVAAERQLSQVELELQNRLAPVYERYANSAEQVRRFESTILPKAEETLSLTREAYKQGELSFVNLLTVQRTNANSRINYLDAVESLRVAEAEIQGLLLSESLTVRTP